MMLSKLRANSETKRYLSVIILLGTLLPIAIVTSYGQIPGRYIGLVGFSLAAMLGLYEVYRTMGIHKYLAILLTLIVIPFMLLNYPDFQGIVEVLDISSSTRARWALRSWPIYLIVLLAMLIPFAFDLKYRQQKGAILNGVITYVVTIVALIFIKMIWTLTIKDFWLFAFFVLVAVISDSAAYLGGRLFGRRKINVHANQPKRNKMRHQLEAFLAMPLAKTISPKKTLVGFLIGFIFTALFAIIAAYYTNVWASSNAAATSILAGLALAVAAPVGDLAFSAIKRYRGVKDFSNLIPGHGGIFDRFDALSFVIFVAALTFVLT